MKITHIQSIRPEWGSRVASLRDPEGTLVERKLAIQIGGRSCDLRHVVESSGSTQEAIRA